MKKVFQWKKKRYRVLQTAVRIILVLIVAAAAISAIYIGRKPYGEELKEGDVSLRTIYTPIEFKYPVGVDEEKTKLEKQNAAEAVEEVYDIDPETTKQLLEKLDKFFNAVSTAQKAAAENEASKLAQIQTASENTLSETDLKSFLTDNATEETSKKTRQILKDTLAQGIIIPALEKKLAKSTESCITLRNPETNSEKRVSIASLSALKTVKKELGNTMQSAFPENRKLRMAIIALTEPILKANLSLNTQLTQQRKDLAYENAAIQYQEKEVKKEELIVARGERVTKAHLLKIKEMFHRQVKVNRFMFFSGATILSLLFLIIIYIYLKLYEPGIFFNTRNLLLIGVLFIAILGIAKAITYSPLPSYAIPTAIASILTALLIGPRVAIIVTIVLSIFVGIIAGDQLNITTVSFVGGIVGIFFIRDARRRSQILSAGCLVGLANFASICAVELLHGLKYTVFLKQGFWGLLNGIFAAIIITGILPVFEYLFNIVTNISLLELSDLNHPLLKDMVLKAPGTYHHSLIVGNLAEAASEAIGANALLARVGSYFHDIGKTEKAEYFSENQMGIAKRKHDKLTPSMSSLIITNHVKDGVELAHKYKLNQAIIDFIEQHHGTSLIYFFYQRALEKVEDTQMLKEEGFRYPGPKPQTKETAVVLLADSAEASSRALSEPTPARIKGLVRKIINNKFIDNQLDQCELTLKDLEVIAATFSHILMGIFHSRVEYDADTKNKPEDRNKE